MRVPSRRPTRFAARAVFSVAPLLLGLVPSLARAGGFEFGANGTESLGRAGAFTAKADSALALEYNVAGFELWSQINDSAGGDNDIGHGVAFDPAGNVVSVGEEYTANDFARTWVRKHDPAGAELWTQIHDGVDAGNDIAWAVAIDPDTGHIYAAGEEYRVGQFADVWLTKYAP